VALEERLTIINDNLGAVMRAVDAQTEVMSLVTTQLAEILNWINRPASSDLQDALKDIALALQAVNRNLNDLPQRVLAARTKA